MSKRKLLIVTKNFPPFNATSSSRPYAWAKYLKEQGWQPIVVCTATDKGELKTDIDIHYVPVDEYFMFKLLKINFIKNSKILWYLIGVINQLLEYYFWYNPHNVLYTKCSELLDAHKDLDLAIITSRPFFYFNLGYRLKRKYGRLRWIADYRDDWNTSELFNHLKDTFRVSFFRKIETSKERKWLSNASFFTTVSPYYVDKISKLLRAKTKGYCIENGYMEEDFKVLDQLNQLPKENGNKFIISYVGSCYASQDLSIIIKTFCILISEYNYDISLQFIGTRLNSMQKSTISKICKSYQVANFVIELGRKTKEESILLQGKSDALLLVPHKNLKGVPSSKMYEYLRVKRPIIVCPSDKDIIVQTTSNTGAGIVFSNEKEGAELLIKHFESVKNGDTNIIIDDKAVDSYERKNSSLQLEKLLCELDEN